MSCPPIPTWHFALVVVRKREGLLKRPRFLVVQEVDGSWYLPAGAVDPGESLTDAACRETLEETGIAAVLEGIVRVQHTPYPDGTARLRVVFVAKPADDRPPKIAADEESLQAAWVTLEELDRLRLRSDEVRDILQAVARGAAVAPLSLLGREGDPGGWR